jgi:hypothetical protein
VGVDIVGREHVGQKRLLSDFPGGSVLQVDELLYTPCDVLVPAAVGGVVHAGNAAKLQVCPTQMPLSCSNTLNFWPSFGSQQDWQGVHHQYAKP